MKCKRCSGGGEIPSNQLPMQERFPGQWSSCPDCKGTGNNPIMWGNFPLMQSELNNLPFFWHQRPMRRLRLETIEANR
jgi:hypothetical protein